MYGSPGTEVDIEDRVLAHLQIVIVAKLRRNETFALSWQHGQDGGGGRSTIWLHPAIPLQFRFGGNRQSAINRAWIDELMTAASSTSGMQVSAEPPSSVVAPARAATAASSPQPLLARA